MTELQAALGLSQMQRLDDFVARRHQLAGRYNERLARLPITLPWQHPDAFSGMHLYVIRLGSEQPGRSRREMFDALRAAGIGVNVHYIPVHTQPFFQAMGFQEHDFPEAVAYYQQAMSLPLFHGMTDEQQDFVIEEIERQCEEGAQ
jgi:dTDP-4-amino-4,6-dideoxygalactose transaminase